ncbi:MAG TPA: sugar ABC transporter substrate-binding protein [Phycisphaerales bacterium]|nr:sugar ABC transporter substrate-binding protein [Phycisphaerales bacterium]
MRIAPILALLLALATIAAVVPVSRVVDPGPSLLFTVWGMPFEDALFRDRYARVYDELNPRTRVEYQRHGPDLIAKYNAWHTLGKGADVMRIRITEYAGMAARGMLEPLTQFIESDNPSLAMGVADYRDIPAHLRTIIEIGGEVYAIPEDNAQYGLFYNRAIFDRHNAEHPDQRVEYPNPDWRWGDLRRAARLLTRADESGRTVQFGIDFHIWAWPFMTFFAQAGGELWSEDGLTCLIDSPAGVETLEFFRAMQREDGSFSPSFGWDTGVGAEARFANGQTAMYFDGSWRVPNFEIVAPGLDFAVSPLPRGRRPAVVSGCVLWAISANSRHKEEAWRMIRWLTAPEQAIEYWDTLRVAPPARDSVLRSERFRTTSGVPKAGRPGEYEVPPLTPERFEDRAAWLLYANTPHPETGEPPGFVPVHEFQTDLEMIIQRMLEAYLNPSNTETAQDVLGRAVREIHGVMDRDRAAKGLPRVDRGNSQG